MLSKLSMMFSNIKKIAVIKKFAVFFFAFLTIDTELHNLKLNETEQKKGF